MTTTLWIDASAGAAGDMICGALLDAGGDLDTLRTSLEALAVPGYTLSAEPALRGPIAATWFRVHLDEPAAHSHHEHDHQEHDAHGDHRPYRVIRELLASAALPERARERASRVFARLAKAEARVHGCEPDEVVFHEVGSVDAIVDVVGACLLMEQLGVDRLVASPLPLGSGTVETAHGTLSIPVPAVLELVLGWPTIQDGRTGELITPTGAAILTALAEPGPMPSMRPLAVGHGAGTRNPTDRANVTRVVLGESGDGASLDRVEVIEAQVDDLPGEALPPLLQALFEAGAVDAYATAVFMKKGRAGLLITALAPPEGAEAVGDALLRHSSTFGLRRYTSARRVLARRHETVQTPYGEVRIKLAHHGGEVLHAAPEHEDCAARARQAGVPVIEVHQAAIAAWRRPK